MENPNWIKHSIDDIVFDGRNKTYGAFQLRRLYDKHMTWAMMTGLLFFMLAISSPKIMQLINGFMPEKPDEITITCHTFTEPPPTKPNTPPPPRKVEPPPIKDQIKFVPPVVKKDDDVTEIENIPPTIDSLAAKDPSDENREGKVDGVLPGTGKEPEATPPIEEPEANEPFTFVEQMPAFPDGMEAMYRFINSRIKYPSFARENGISGQVTVQFVVSKEGDIQNVKVVRGIGGACNEEAIRIVESMPRWKPGMHNGRAVPVTLTLPIKFVLQ